MSTSIDTKVVEMKFDNKDFEANVKNSMSTLDKLKSKLNLAGAASGLESIQKAANGISFSGLIAGVSSVSSQFNVLGTAVDQVVRNITNSLMGLASNLVNTFAIEPIFSGFEEYELKMSSIQTIMASTGASLEEVNGYLDELNTYSDKTIYSFSDMTSNIGKFTNAGVDLKTAVKAIQGVSNEAAVSGANTNEASRAMYNFAQALSAGYVKLIDWKSIENANMATVEFKQQLIDTAVECGTLEKQADGMYKVLTTNASGSSMDEAISSVSNFNDSLAYQWMTTDVLTTTLGRYADETTDIGKKAFASAEDVKTFSMMMDTLKETAGSGWAQTYEAVIGDFEQAKVFWTELTNIFSNALENISDVRNNFIKSVMGGTESSWSELSSKIEGTGVTLDQFQTKLVEVGESQGVAVTEILTAEGTMEDAFKNGKLSGQLVVDTLNAMTDSTKELAKEAENSDSEFSTMLDNIAAKSGRDMFVGTITNTVNAIFNIINTIGEAWSEAFSMDKSVNTVKAILESLYNLSQRFVDWSKTRADVLKRSLSGIFSVLSLIKDIVVGVLSVAFGTFGKVLDATSVSVLDVTAVIGDAITAVVNWVRNNEILNAIINTVVTVLYTLVGVFATVAKGVKDTTANVIQFVKNSQMMRSLGAMVQKLADKYGSLQDVIRRGISILKQYVQLIAEWISKNKTVQEGLSALSKIGDQIKTVFGDVMKSVSDFFSNFDPIASALEISQNGLKGLQNAFSEVGTVAANSANRVSSAASTYAEKLSSMASGIFSSIDIKGDAESILSTVKMFAGSVANILTDTTNTVATAFDSFMAEFGNYIVPLAGTIGLIKVLDKAATTFQSLNDALKTLMSPITMFQPLVKAAASVCTEFSKTIKTFKYVMYATVVVELAGAFKTVAEALEIIGNIDTASLIKGGIVLGVFTACMTVLMRVCDGSVRAFKIEIFQAMAVAIVALAAAVAIIAASLYVLSKVNFANMLSAVIGLTSIFAGLAGVFVVINKWGNAKNTKLVQAFGVMCLELSASMLLLVAAIKIMDGMSLESVDTGVNVISRFLVFMGILAMVAKASDAASMSAMGSMALALSASLLIVVGVIKIAGNMDARELTQGIVVVTILGVFLALIVKVISKEGNAVIKVGGTILALSISIGILVGVAKLASSLSADEFSNGCKAIGVFGALIVGIVAAMKYVGGGQAAKIGLSMLGVSIAIGALVGVCLLCGMLDQEALNKGLSAVIVLGAMMTLMISALKGAGEAPKSIAAMAVSIAVMVAAVVVLSMLDTAALLRSAVALSVMMAAYSLMIKALSGFNSEAKGFAKTIVLVALMTTVVVALAAVITQLAGLDPNSVVPNTLALSTLLLAFSAALKIISSIKGPLAVSNANLGIMVAITEMLALVLASMSGLEVQNSLTNALALSVLLNAFATAVLILSHAQGDFITAIAAMPFMIAVTAALGLVLAGMSILNVQSAIPNAIALGVLLNAMSAAVLILSLVHGPATQGIVALAALSAVVTALVSIIGVINEITNGGMLSTVESAIPVMAAIGEALGQFVGGLVGGALESLASKLPQIGTYISEFFVNLNPFMAAISALEGKDYSGVKQLSEVIISLAAADLMSSASSIVSFFSGNDVVSSFTKYGEALSGFSEEMSKANPSGLVKAALIAPSVQALFSALPSSGGLAESIFGSSTNTFETLEQTLPSFGRALLSFSNNMAEVNLESVSKGVDAAKNVAEIMMLDWPTTGGLAGMIFGDSTNSLGYLKDNLVSLGSAIKDFGDGINGVDSDVIAKGVDAVKNVAEIMKIEWPTSGGLWGMIAGDSTNTLSSLTEQLKPLGEAVKNFADATAGMTDTSGVASGKDVLASIAEMLNNTNVQSVFSTKLELDGEGLSYTLSSLGAAARTFANNTAGADYGSVEIAISALSSIADFVTTKLATMSISAEAASSFVAVINELASADVSTMVQQFQNGATSMTDAGVDFAQNFINGFMSTAPNATAEVISMNDTLKTTMYSYLETFLQAGRDIALQVANGITAAKTNATNAISGLLSGADSTIRSYYSGFYDAGAYCVEGLANGISDNRSLAIKAAENTAAAALEAANNKLGVASPSREFMKTGRWSVIGLARGLTDNAHYAEDAGKSLAETVMSTTSESLGYLSDLQDIKMGFASFTPVVDYSGIGTYNGSFDLSASLGNVITTPLKSNIELLNDAQSAITSSNDKVLTALNSLNTNVQGYSTAIANSETAMYIDGKKLASTIAKPINQQLGVLSRRGI